MLGVVACEALYNVVQRYASDAEVRYIPAELHEFPVNVPLHAEVASHVQSAIDHLVEAGCDEIVVSYSMNEETRSSLDGHGTSLTISPEDDCISSLLPGTANAYGEKKAPGCLYLTRGWIDCGVDGYKLYRAYRDDLDGLLELFEDAQYHREDLRVTWHRGDRFERTRREQPPTSGDLLDRFFLDIVQYYDQIVLVDTGDLHELHHTYTAQVQSFVTRLKSAGDASSEVTIEHIDADLSTMRSLLQASDLA